MSEYFDRAIDDPGLNQDSTFDRKDNEDFDDSDDFHKYDDTSQDKTSEKNTSNKKQSKPKDSQLNTPGSFDGNIAI